MSRWIQDVQGITTVLDSNGDPVPRRKAMQVLGATVTDNGSATVIEVPPGPTGPAPSMATTTQQLGGTNSAVAATPDSVAALWETGADNSGGASIVLGEGGAFNLITSTTAITSISFSNDKAGRTARIRFNTARTLTHNASTLILPGGTNITTAAGDVCGITSLGGGAVRVDWYTKATGRAIIVDAQPAASDTVPGLIEIATKAEQETGTDTTRAVTPGRQHSHPSAAKFWAYVTVSAGVPSIADSYNVTSITDSGTGQLTVTIATDFSSANWCCGVTVEGTNAGSALYGGIDSSARAAGAIRATSYNNAASLTDPVAYNVWGFGDQ